MTKHTWIVVADGGRARILAHEPASSPSLRQIFDHDLVAAHGRAQDIDASAPGRVTERAHRQRHAMEPSTDSVRHAERDLATRVIKELERAPGEGVGRIVFVAPPRTLGDLREACPKTLQALVTDELGKDLTHLTPHQLAEHLAETLAKS